MRQCKTFDRDALLERLGGDETFVFTLLGVALRATEPLPADLRAACSAADYVTLATLSHKAKGTAGDLVAEPIRRRARDTEIAARAAASESLLLGVRLADSVDELLAELRTITSTNGPQPTGR